MFSSSSSSSSLFDLLCWIVLVAVIQLVTANISWLSGASKRRLQHALTGHVFVQISYVFPVKRFCVPALLVGASGLYYLRRYHPDFFVRTFGSLLRPREIAVQQEASTKVDDGDGKGKRSSSSRVAAPPPLPGAFYFLLGTAFAAAAFPPAAARYAIECLSVADPAASWIGTSIRSPTVAAGKSLAGTLACLASSLFVGFVMFSRDAGDDEHDRTDVDGYLSARQIICGAVACCLAETFAYGDDNLVIPIVTAAATYLTGDLEKK